MKIILGEWFDLPRLGKETFLRLVREARLKYEKGRGFKTQADTDLYLLSSILEGVLHEDIELNVKCYICGSEIGCSSCIYDELCDKRRISPMCICDDCKDKEAFTLYSLRFTESCEW